MLQRTASTAPWQVGYRLLCECGGRSAAWAVESTVQMLWLGIKMRCSIKRLQLSWLVDKHDVLPRCRLPNTVQRLPQPLDFLLLET